MDVALVSVEGIAVASDIEISSATGDFRQATDLETAIKLSLFLNARARPGDRLPSGETGFGSNLGGWWGEAYLPDGGQFGSRLWTLKRSSLSQETRQKARDFSLEALRWMIDSGIATSTPVTVSIPERGVLGILVEPTRGDQVLARFEYLWEAISGSYRSVNQ